MNNGRAESGYSKPLWILSASNLRLPVHAVTMLFVLFGQAAAFAAPEQVAERAERDHPHSAHLKTTQAEFDVFADDEAAARWKILPTTCYQIDNKQAVLIDWGVFSTEKEAEACFFGVAVKLGEAKSFEWFLAQNGFRTAAGKFHSGLRVVEGWRVFSGYKSAAQYFGPLSPWALQVLNPLDQAVAMRGSGGWLFRIRLEYSHSGRFRPHKVSVNYNLSVK